MESPHEPCLMCNSQKGRIFCDIFTFNVCVPGGASFFSAEGFFVWDISFQTIELIMFATFGPFLILCIYREIWVKWTGLTSLNFIIFFIFLIWWNLFWLPMPTTSGNKNAGHFNVCFQHTLKPIYNKNIYTLCIYTWFIMYTLCIHGLYIHCV